MKIIPDKWRPINFCKRYVRRKTSNRVHCGPFEGMQYVDKSVGSEYFPKLLGTYEMELHEIIGSMRGDVSIIGAGEGYYAVGLARNGCSVKAYESEALGRQLMLEMAELNGVVDNVEIKGSCTPKDLNSLDQYTIMDIEGEEIDFLDVIRKSSTQWIIEIHSSVIKNKMENRLNENFHVQFLPVKHRTMSDFTVKIPMILRFVFQRYWKSLLQEWRSDSIGWLILTPK